MMSREAQLRRSAQAERGQGLVEVIIALTILAVAIGALLTVMTAGAVSLQRSDKKGTALTIAEAQIELYRNLTYSDVRLASQLLPVTPASDPYNTANATDSTIPSSAGQITDATPSSTIAACPGGTSPPPECRPVQTEVGPDNGSYRVDTYITAHTPTGGSPIRQVTVIVRDAAVKGLPILARNTSTFSPINTASAKSLPKLVATAPAAAVLTDSPPVPKTAIEATLSGAQNPTGTITFFVNGPRTTAPTACVGGGWTQVGTAPVAGNASYTSDGDYTPTAVGNYWWYASYSGDNGNNPTNSACGGAMAMTTVIAAKANPSISVSAPANAFKDIAVPPTSITANLTGGAGPTGQMVVTVFGPSATAPSTCTSGGTQVGTALTPTGNGTYPVSTSWVPTTTGNYWWYATFAGDTTDTAAVSACGSGMTETVVKIPPDVFGVSSIPGSTAGAPLTVNLTANLAAGGVDAGYTGTQCITFSGPSASPDSTPPTYPASGPPCASGESSITFNAGVATGIPLTLFAAETTTLTATDTHGSNGAIVGQSNSFTVDPGPTTAFALTNPGAQTAGVQFGVTVKAKDTWGNQTTDGGSYAVSWSGANKAPDNTAPIYGSSTLFFASGSAVATGFKFFDAASTTLTLTQNGSHFSTSFTVNEGPTATITLADPGQQTAGTSFGVSITAKDSWQNPETGGHTISWSGASNSPSNKPPIYGASAVTFVGGSAIVSGFTLYNAASTTLKATEASVNGTRTFSVVAASVQLSWGCPTTKKNTKFTETVTRGSDPYGNTDPNRPSAITITFSQTGGVTLPGNLTIGAGSPSGTSGNFTNPDKGIPVTITAHSTTAGYTDATCSYTTTP